MSQTVTRQPLTRTVGAGAALIACLWLGHAQPAHAQQPASSTVVLPPAGAAPPPGYVQPGQPYPPGYAQPGQPYPPGYAQPQPQPQPYPGYPYSQPAYPYGSAQPQQRVIKGWETKRPHWPLLIAGISILGGSYLLTAGITGAIQATDCAVNTTRTSCTTSGTYWPMYIPVVGPFVEMSYLSGNSWAPLAYPGLVFAGLVQSAGLGLIIAGAAAPRKVPIYSDEPRLSIAPYTMPSGGGVMASGRF